MSSGNAVTYMYIPCVCAYLGLAEHDVEAAVGAVDDDFLGPD